MNDLIEEFNILIPEILKFYDLGNFEKILNFINYKKYQNIVLIFQTSKGKYILKEYRRGRNINDIKYKLNLIASLLLNPKLKLTLVLNKENKSYVEFNDRIFSIDKYIENFEKEFDYEERLINLAIFLASFHKEGLQKLNTKKEIEKISDFFFFDRFPKFKDIISKKEVKTEFDLFLINKLFPFIELEIKDYKENVNKFKLKKTKSILHGDFYSGQLIFNGAEIAALFDYDAVFEDFHGVELARALSVFIPFDKEKGFDLRLLNNFLQSYIQVIGELDINYKEMILLLRHSLIDVIGRSLTIYLKSGNDYQKVIISNYDKLVWLRKNLEQIKSLFNFN